MSAGSTRTPTHKSPQHLTIDSNTQTPTVMRLVMLSALGLLTRRCRERLLGPTALEDAAEALLDVAELPPLGPLVVLDKASAVALRTFACQCDALERVVDCGLGAGRSAAFLADDVLERLVGARLLVHLDAGSRVDPLGVEDVPVILKKRGDNQSSPLCW
eukprot:8603775-Alexandrium_andersonii.AAC.1